MAHNAQMCDNSETTEESRLSIPYRCIASACMMWRSEPQGRFEGGSLKPPHGFCGLAGKP
jgi:hypothetical protein